VIARRVGEVSILASSEKFAVKNDRLKSLQKNNLGHWPREDANSPTFHKDT
jgi:hypothetical protein